MVGTVLLIVFVLMLVPVIVIAGCWVLMGTLSIIGNNRVRHEVSSVGSVIKRLAVIVLIVWVLVASISALSS
jgi:hypothetical protein